jgi:tRNA pseudouridine32 synthase/23S rRNA pseudouridine746 synthase
MGEVVIVYQCEHVVVVDKPSGWLSVPSRMGDQDSRRCLGLVLQEQLGVRLWPVHRLDVPVSGLVMFALNAWSHKVLNRAFEQHEVVKVYEALCEEVSGSAEMADGQEVREASAAELRWEDLLLRGKKRAYESPVGKASITYARQIEEVEAARLGLQRWSLRPQTGRPHQLRYHMAKYAAPILGDRLYGATRGYGSDEADEMIALRARRVELGGVAERERLKLPEVLEVSGLGLKP